MTMATKIEKGGSGFHTYSPISTLEKQYASPVGQRVLLFVKTNANCCLEGGVESIMKMKSGTVAALATEKQDYGATESNHSERSDPFSFLNEEERAAVAADAAQTKKGPNLGRFLKKVAKSTTHHLERGVHNLAIRADKGRNPDLLILGLYDDTNALLNMTESQPLPEEESRLHGVRFFIPLELPGNYDPNRQVSIKLWIRSGAALLQTNKSLSTNYLIGSVHLNAGQLRHSVQNRQCSFLHETLGSAVVADGKLHVCATPDLKFPPLCGRGWSLADPDPSGYGAGKMFNLPLDQSYGFTLPALPSACLVATERSIESSVVLPIATAFAQMASNACKISLSHHQAATSFVLANRHDSAVGEYADCNVILAFLKTNNDHLGATPVVTASYQRPDSIFEVELMPPTSIPVQPKGGEFRSTASFRFFPKPCREGVLPALLQSHGGRFPPNGFMLGNVRLEIAIPRPRGSNGTNADNPYGSVGTGNQSVNADEDVWECIISLESVLQRPPNSGAVMEYPVYHPRTGSQMGSIVLSVAIQMQQQGQASPAKLDPAMGGLLSLVGLPPLVDYVQPDLDFNTHASYSDPNMQRRQQQWATMGVFVTHAYMEQHLNTIRSMDARIFDERASAYRTAVSAGQSKKNLPTHEDRRPRPLRPSSSRSEMVLSGIPFNVHTASLSLNVMDSEKIAGEPVGDLFHNITCGAPADHARGYGNVFPARKEPDATNIGLNCPIGPVSGGLRRLELKRQELAKQVTDLQTTLVMSVANFFTTERQRKKIVNHVPSRHAELRGLRWRVFEAVQSLHHLSWICAVRRASVFSQALGLAVTSFLASISDSSKLQSSWPEIWARHGYLVSFEGLLTAAGKELGMIEDASVGISMLHKVQVVLVPDDGALSSSSRVVIPYSPYLKWLDLSSSGSGSTTEYILKIGMASSYYQERIPSALKNGVHVRFYSLLFEVGVDIRQWGAYAGSSMKNQLGATNKSDEEEKLPMGGLIEDEDDDTGFSDEDVLVQLNYEAFRKMNNYAHAISPTGETQSQQASNQKTHPWLETLYQHIVSSSGKMNHDILDEAALLAQQLGGGGVVFCKSGKDRTAMHVTFKQAQFANKYRQRNLSDEDAVFLDTTLPDAMVMRIHGTRLPICEKNVGESKYAFNSLQVKFMPDALKPPMNTLAGFLKGGKVFTGGGIES